ncbi:cytotardin-like [Gouania willdenowi]|uniref:cytotardin-like n=1 Tax=Gouania willdenowi TaxID=441366 RepID=UPI001054C742|nr:cytotardin-like [Gouania willdenowi]
MHEERKQMIQKINSNAEQWEKAKAEVNQAAAQHSVTSAMLEEQERTSFTEEQNTQKLIENLRKDLNAHIVSQQLLKTQCVQINSELKNLQRTLAKTNKQLDTDFEGVSVAAKALENKLEKMLKLTEGLEMFEYEHSQTLFRIEKQKNELQDQLRSAQAQEQAIRNTFEQTEALITDVIEKREEFHSSSTAVQTMVENMPEVIAQLQKSLKVVEYKHKAAALLMSHVQTLMDSSDQHTQRSEWIYSNHRAATTEQVKKTQV